MSFAARRPRPPDLPQLLAYAGWLLARRDYTAAELLTKFRTRFLAAEPLFAAALQKLTELGLQSDRRAAESFISAHAGWGSTRLKLELAHRGVAAEIVAALLPCETDELTRAQKVLAGKLRGSPPPAAFAERQKLLALLVRRGFSLDTARAALETAD